MTNRRVFLNSLNLCGIALGGIGGVLIESGALGFGVAAVWLMGCLHGAAGAIAFMKEDAPSHGDTE